MPWHKQYWANGGWWWWWWGKGGWAHGYKACSFVCSWLVTLRLSAPALCTDTCTEPRHWSRGQRSYRAGISLVLGHPKRQRRLIAAGELTLSQAERCIIALCLKQTRELQWEAATQAKTGFSFVIFLNVRKHYPDKTACSEKSTLSVWVQQASFLFFIFYVWSGGRIQWLHGLTCSRK